MADILGDLYLMSATLRRFEDEGRIAEDKPLVDAIMDDLIASIEKSLGRSVRQLPQSAVCLGHALPVLPAGAACQARPAIA